VIGTIEYRECNKSFPGIKWCIVRTNGEVYPLHKDFIDTLPIPEFHVEFVLTSDKYGIGLYGYVTKEITKEDFREHILNKILYDNN